ncbi:MAG: hypothetical protein QXK93_04825 [Candidatus Bathyarchaeia archaeon]
MDKKRMDKIPRFLRLLILPWTPFLFMLGYVMVVVGERKYPKMSSCPRGENMTKGKIVTEEMSISKCLEDAKDDLYALYEEMDSWRSNMEGTNLEYTQKYEMVSECADILEEQCSRLEDFIAEIEGVEGFDLEMTVKVSMLDSKRMSRQDRLSNVTSLLNAAKEGLEEQLEEKRRKVEELEGMEELTPEQEEERKKLEEQISDMEDRLNELDDIISELDSVEFPGMYG